MSGGLDSYRLLLALACPDGVEAVPEHTEQARLTQTRVTEKLREQARMAIEEFVQAVLDQPENQASIESWEDRQALARTLWREGLVLVYRLLFVFKLESSADPARAFSFASSRLWRQTYSPTTALAPVVGEALGGASTGSFLESSLRTLFRVFAEGLDSSELKVSPLGGMLFGKDTTPVLDGLDWGEYAVARLLDNLLWTPGGGKIERMRVHYGPLDVEDLGRVYEALLELEPGIATEPMCRLRRHKLEVLVPAEQGEPYKDGKKGKTKVEWVEDIRADRFYLRVGLGRKSTGSYYTPHPFVRFLVQETLGPQVAERSPREDPQPGAILALKVLDPAMGSGHFLVEACRYLGDQLYEACRLCDELAVEAEQQAEKVSGDSEKESHLAKAAELRRRVEDLPDPDDAVLAYLPSRAPEGEASGLSQFLALALCRRLVAVHCLYGVDKNLLAVELAKLSLWLESYAEGLPLTFMDHRLVLGDSLTGPFVEHLLTYPHSGKPVEGLYVQGLTGRLEATLADALSHVRDLETSVGKDVAELQLKRAAKEHLDAALAPFRTLAAAWSGGVMLGDDGDDSAYEALLMAVAGGDDGDKLVAAWPVLGRMVEVGEEGLPYDLAFPEVFHPGGEVERAGGFDAVVGNPPWDAIRRADDQFFGGFDLQALAGATKREKKTIQEALLEIEHIGSVYAEYIAGFQRQDRSAGRLFKVHQARVKGNLAGRGTYDAYMLFAERCIQALGARGRCGLLLPSAFHANEGATGLRRLFLDDIALRCCFSFENRNKLFEIDSRFKFAAVVGERCEGGTDRFPCGFYLHDLEWLFQDNEPLWFTRSFVERTGGDYLSFLELRTQADVDVAAQCFTAGLQLGGYLDDCGMKLSQEVNMTYDAHRFTPTPRVVPPGTDPRDPDVAHQLLDQGYLPLHEGKTFQQFDDRWADPPRYLVHLDQIADKLAWKQAARYYRLAFRDIASSTNERTGIFCLSAPGFLFGNTAPCEREPGARNNLDALVLLASINSHAADFTLRVRAATHVNLFILNNARLAPTEGIQEFLVHSALRLTCNHAGYAPLWTEQVGDEWREPRPRHTWPVLETDDERWAVRASIDAVVADAYGLSREQYQHVLSTFSHRSYPEAPKLCLAAFDELQATGLDAFTRQHDPYWDVPLNESLPQPVIDLPGVGDEQVAPGVVVERSGQTSFLAPDLGPLFSQGRKQEVAEKPLPKVAESRPTYGAVPDDDDPYERLQQLLQARGVIRSGDAQEHLGMDANTVRPYLRRLVDEGLARTEGQRRGMRYVWAVAKDQD